MAQPRKRNWALQAALCGGLCVYQIYDSATATQSPSTVLALLQYFIIGGTFVGFVSALIMMAKGLSPSIQTGQGEAPARLDDAGH
jgi:hypothetical protein